MYGYLPNFPKNCSDIVCGVLQTILNFYVICKNPFISETMSHRVILAIFLAERVYAKTSARFPKNLFATIFGSHLKLNLINFYVKHISFFQKAIFQYWAYFSFGYIMH